MKSKRERFITWLDRVIEPDYTVPVYPKLEGTGIEFHVYRFKTGTTMLMQGMNNYLLNLMPEEHRHVYIVDISGKMAFEKRYVNGVCDNVLVYSMEFSKLLEDTNWYTNNRLGSFISSWVKTLINATV